MKTSEQLKEAFIGVINQAESISEIFGNIEMMKLAYSHAKVEHQKNK